MKKTSTTFVKLLCNLLLLVAPVLVSSTQSFVLWDEVKIPDSLK